MIYSSLAAFLSQYHRIAQHQGQWALTEDQDRSSSPRRRGPVARSQAGKVGGELRSWPAGYAVDDHPGGTRGRDGRGGGAPLCACSSTAMGDAVNTEE